MLTERFSLGFLEEYKLKVPNMKLVEYSKHLASTLRLYFLNKVVKWELKIATLKLLKKGKKQL